MSSVIGYGFRLKTGDEHEHRIRVLIIYFNSEVEKSKNIPEGTSVRILTFEIFGAISGLAFSLFWPSTLKRTLTPPQALDVASTSSGCA